MRRHRTALLVAALAALTLVGAAFAYPRVRYSEEHPRQLPVVALGGAYVPDVGGASATVRYVEGVAVGQYLAAVHEVEVELAAARAPRRASRGGGGSGGTCAGSIPGWVIYRESKCDPRAVNGRSGAAGKYQVLASTWDGYAGYATADAAPESVQDAWAAEAYAAAGCRPWGGC